MTTLVRYTNIKRSDISRAGDEFSLAIVMEAINDGLKTVLRTQRDMFFKDGEEELKNTCRRVRLVLELEEDNG